MDAPTATALASIVTMLSGEAIKAYGPLALLAIVPALIFTGFIVSLKRQLAARDEELKVLRREKDAEIAELRKEKEAALEKRVEAAEATMRLARSGTETMAARTEGDQAFRDLLVRLTGVVSEVREGLRDLQQDPPRSRRPSR